MSFKKLTKNHFQLPTHCLCFFTLSHARLFPFFQSDFCLELFDFLSFLVLYNSLSFLLSEIPIPLFCHFTIFMYNLSILFCFAHFIGCSFVFICLRCFYFLLVSHQYLPSVCSVSFWFSLVTFFYFTFPFCFLRVSFTCLSLSVCLSLDTVFSISFSFFFFLCFSFHWHCLFFFICFLSVLLFSSFTVFTFVSPLFLCFWILPLSYSQLSFLFL